ncbi:hypothetical protein AZI86_10985 [Bdellovibrio bacteriovorus]|uniref:Glycosyltransferase n=1 Tax=Bdellovibrio bacteriovorus TaxID=959 RepID=A0A150WLE8_BDEBC|nr:glycosyltransferase family 1 protein [Bdellovibrio bacteriovorus]KYG64726.1 hypothetical protein AZI86_10985 [Bdellovibrio bacteriovorus]
MERLKNKVIFFCFPYREVGGVSLLFLRMAEYLAGKIPNEIYIVDYADGYMATHRKSAQVKLLEYKDDLEVVIPDNGILVLQAMTPWSIYSSLRPLDGCKLFFWNCYPYNLVPAIPGLRNWLHGSETRIIFFLNSILFAYKLRVVRFLKLLLKYDAIAFMDRVNLDTTERIFGVNCDKREYLPVTLQGVDEICDLEVRNVRSPLRAAWIGRIADFKVHILLYTMRKMAHLAMEQERVIEFTVVGRGEYLYLIQEANLENNFFKVRYISELTTSEVEKFLRDEVDVLFAMGTSALEGARMGVPTVLLDISYVPITGDYVYQFLFEQDGYVLGDVINGNSFTSGNQSLSKVIAALDQNYALLCKKSYNYFEKNHSIDSAAEKLIDCLERDKLAFSVLKGHKVLSQPLSYRLLRYLRARV